MRPVVGGAGQHQVGPPLVELGGPLERQAELLLVLRTWTECVRLRTSGCAVVDVPRRNRFFMRTSHSYWPS